MKDKTQTITIGIIWIFLLCYFMQLFNFPNELTVVLGGILCVILVLQQKKFRIDIGICLLSLTLISYYVITNGVRGLAFSILYIPLVIYELGNYSVCAIKSDREKERKALILILAMIIGWGIYGILNSCMWYAGYVVPGTRRWQDFWSGEIVPGTQHTAYFLPIFAMFFPAILNIKKSKALSLLTITMTVFFAYTSLATRSRMSVLIFAIVVCLQVMLFIILEKENIKKYIKSKWLWISAAVGIVVVGEVVFLLKDSAVVVAFIANMSKDGGILNNIRFEAQKNALQQIFRYPMGGYQMQLGELGQAHNTWLDIANAAGVIPFFAFTMYTVYSLWKMLRLLRNSEIETSLKLVISGVYVAFFLYFSVEPALEASIHLITPWIFVNAVVHGMLKTKENIRKGTFYAG